MALNKDIKKVLVIGSGPIVIGQAAEFDYSGTQACESLKEEGIEVVLVNSNPATIMTDKEVADKVYIERSSDGTITLTFMDISAIDTPVFSSQDLIIFQVGDFKMKLDSTKTVRVFRPKGV